MMIAKEHACPTSCDFKQAEQQLHDDALAKYPTLSTSAIKQLVVYDKWLTAPDTAIQGEMDAISQRLTSRVTELADRYGTTLPELSTHASELEAKVAGHLKRMGFAL